MPVVFETAIRLVLPTPGIALSALCPEPHRNGAINLFRGSHPTLLLSYGTKTRRKPTLLLRLPGVSLLRLADRQFLALLFQLPPRRTRFEPTIDALSFTMQTTHDTHFFEFSCVGILGKGDQWHCVVCELFLCPETRLQIAGVTS